MKRMISVFCLAFFVTFLCCSCAAFTKRYQYVDTAMGTIMQFQLYAEEKESADVFSEEAIHMLTQLEKEQLSWRSESSEVYQINETAGSGQKVMPSDELAQILETCLQMWEASGGAFDITLGALGRLWQIDALAAGEVDEDTFCIPTAEEIADALQLCGSDKLITGDATVGLILPTGLQLDLGAVGKGIALDKIKELFTNAPGISGAVISAGGSILVYGSKPDNSHWKVGVVNPFDTATTIGTLTLDSSGWIVTTSGDYERYVEIGGVRYHHILDPVTGYPVQNNIRGVTVLTDNGLLGDMLSTACYVLGAEEGMELAEKYGAEILFVLSDGEIRMSDGMEQYFSRN